MPRGLLTLRIVYNAAPTTKIYTLSLHDALPISSPWYRYRAWQVPASPAPWNQCPPERSSRSRSPRAKPENGWNAPARSEEHTSELQSRRDLVCRLLLEKKKR